jgi:hypothetical protein
MGERMTEQTGQQAGQSGPPDWWTKPPEWLTNRPAASAPPAGRPASYDAGRQDQELLTAIRAMPEQVVGALKEAIQGANAAASQQPPAQQPPAQQQAAPPAQQQQDNGAQQPDKPPASQMSFADRWFSNAL